jgi:hypothetical protein
VHFSVGLQGRILANVVRMLKPGGVVCLGGSFWAQALRPVFGKLGLAPLSGPTREIYEGWELQRKAWYLSPRPYWALPPYRPLRDGEAPYSALFANLVIRA